MRISKSAAGCPSCSRIFYPTFSPVAITLVSDPTDSYALLIRHKASPASLYTAIAGFAQIDACPGELESARWFSREEVAAALQRTLNDPFLKVRTTDRCLS
ncbi:hypothetical protein COOONC_25854 [Cooperia oncophora]